MASDGNQPGGLSSAWILGVACYLSRSVCCQCDNSWFDCHSLGIATGNTLEGLLGAFLVNYFANGRKGFAQQRDTLTFVLLAALLSTTVSATFGVTSLSLGGYADWERYSAIWITWWLGDAVGALIVTPAIVLWVSDHAINWSRSQLLEIGVSIPLLCLVAWIVFQSSQAMTGP